MSDMRNFLGEGAHAGQKLKIEGNLVSEGKGEFTAVDKNQVAMASQIKIEILKYKFEGPVNVEVKTTGPGNCTVKLWVNGAFQEDKNASYEDVKGHRRIYCKLFSNYFSEICIELWRNGHYSDMAVWTKTGIVWSLVPVLHIWAHPIHVEELLEVPEGRLTANLEPASPSVQA